MARRKTPSTNSNRSTSFQVPKPEPSAIGAPEALPAARAHPGDRELLVEDDPLALAAGLGAAVERLEDALGRGRHLRDPRADGVVDRRRDGRRLGVVRHLADRLGAEGP